jgi:zinc protease
MMTRMDLPSRAPRRLQHVVLTFLVCIGVSNQFIVRAFAQAKPSGGTATAIPRIQRTELLNGLRVLAIERPGEMAVINLLVKAGSFADPGDKAGLANLTAQSVCLANAKLPLQRWKDELEFLGARIEIHLTTDSTVFQAQVPSAKVEAVLALFARLMVQPVFAKEGIDRIKCELRSSKMTLSEAPAIARFHLGELVFGRTACARAEWGTQESVNALRIADLEAFHQAYYLPNNTALIVGGGPPIARLGNLVREKFGSWIKAKLQPTEPAAAPMPARSVIRVIDRKTSSDATILVGHSTPARQSPDFFALTLANTVLGRLGKASRLEQAFAKHNIPHQALSSGLEFKQACGWFQVSAQAPLSALPSAFAAILESIEDMKTRPISETELNQAKSALLSSHRANLETETGLADEVTAIELFDLARDFLSGFPLRVEQVSAERIQEAAKNYLSSTQISGVVVGESQSVKAGLAEFRSFEISEWRESAAKPASAN